GPVLVFLPDLNKPVAVRLRALLWSLYNDAPLPAPSPRDGAMSAVVDVATANPNFYRAIGYPLYGPRVIRIDMLDRVINAVYDGSKEGKFQAEHKMAEWMGCPIADLYAILEAMGHKRQEKPVVVASTSGEPAIEAVAEIVAPVDVVADAVSTEIVAEPTKPAMQKKPELDWFLLRRGKAHTEHVERKPRSFVREDSVAAKPAFPKERFEPKKSYSKKDESVEGEARSSFKKKKRDDTSHDKRSSGKQSDDKRADRKPSNDARVYTAAASATDNPFAILQGLKLK
ncbi:MAG: helicase, partial [Pseudomonadota bacterium]